MRLTELSLMPVMPAESGHEEDVNGRIWYVTGCFLSYATSHYKDIQTSYQHETEYTWRNSILHVFSSKVSKN